MTYKDLRYDNWVKGHLTGRYLRVDWLVMKHMADGNIQSVYTPDIPVYEPIPLTFEILERAWFSDKDYKKGFIGIDVKSGSMTTDFVLTKPFTMGEWQTFYAWGYDDFRFTKIEFVHELQNLYFALTGEELKIEL